ncbi:MAG: TetR/AcrR family transcriptional regulator [Chloroflexi bacterium]|nr:TetR/AcrR family transcriptional regulator [Chloroflexota bacterium]
MNTQRKDRRRERTRQMLQDAFDALIEERGYESVTVEDITDRANVGRTTFYLHYQSKDDLLMSSIKRHVADFSFGMHSAADWLGDQPTPQMVDFYRQSKQRHETRRRSGPPAQDTYIMRMIFRLIVQEMEENLRSSFPESGFAIPLPILAYAMAGVHMWFADWWTEKRPAYTVEEIATTSHRMMKAMLMNALHQSEHSNAPMVDLIPGKGV